MKKHALKSTILILLFSTFTLSLLVVGCSDDSSSKMTITTNSEEARKLYLKGCSYMDNLRRREAGEYFKKALALDSNFAVAKLQLALSSTSNQDIINNLEQIKKDVATASEGEILWVASVDAAFNSKYDEQKKILDQLCALHPADVRCLMLMGSYFYNRQQYQDAIDIYHKIVEVDNEFAPVYNMLGYSYRNLDNFTEAEKHLKKYIELIPNDPNPYDSYAELLLMMGKFEESMENYKKAISIDQYFVFSYTGLATNYNLMGNHIEARNQLKKMLERAKTDDQKREAMLGMAISFVDEGNNATALKLLDKRIQISKAANNPLNQYADMLTLTHLATESGEIELAKKTIEEALKIISSSEQSDAIVAQIKRFKYYADALIAVKENNLPLAKEITESYNQLVNEVQNPIQKRNVHELYGIIALAEDDFATADKELRLTNQLSPRNNYNLGLANKGLGEPEKALSFFKKAAYANTIHSMNYALIRKKALSEVAHLEPVT